MFNNIYKNKTVLITGNSGFKGSWLSLWLNKLGANVIGYSLPPHTEPSIFKALGLEDKITHITGDVRDENTLTKTLQAHKPDIVFHMAAQPLVGLSYEQPKLTYETNIMGTINLFEAVKKTDSFKAIVNVTTDKCYENNSDKQPYKETDPMGGYDPYSSSKGAVELISSAYRNSFFNNEEYPIALATARAGNVIGGGDWAQDRLVPDLIRSLASKTELHIRNPKATRPWQFVLEPLSGYLQLGAYLLTYGAKYAEGWNFGPESESILPVDEIIQNTIKAWGAQDYSYELQNTYHEAQNLTLDINKAKSLLKWQPSYNNKEMLQSTVNWYKKFYEGNENMYEFSLNQINEYCLKAKDLGLLWAIENQELINR